MVGLPITEGLHTEGRVRKHIEDDGNKKFRIIGWLLVPNLHVGGEFFGAAGSYAS